MLQTLNPSLLASSLPDLVHSTCGVVQSASRAGQQHCDQLEAWAGTIQRLGMRTFQHPCKGSHALSVG